jgi:hypothetical protein
MNPNRTATMTEDEYSAHVAAKLSNFGENAGKHSPLAATQVRISLRLSRDCNLRLSNLARAVGMRPPALAVLILESVSRIPPADLLVTLGQIQSGKR